MSSNASWGLVQVATCPTNALIAGVGGLDGRMKSKQLVSSKGSKGNAQWSVMLGFAGDRKSAEEDDPALLSSPADPPKKLQLRKETLMSLGIKTSKPRGCLKQGGSGSGMRRANTLCSLRETEFTLLTGKTITRNVSITFNAEVRARKIPSCTNLAEEDKQELWYQPDEMKSMRSKSKDLIDAAAGQLSDQERQPTSEDLRGLERHMPENLSTRKNRKIKIWDAVLDTQESQRCTGKFDGEQIATMIRAMSNESLREARHRAQEDATAVGC
jgi:hypothetical protein